ncbi:MAG: chemotaxis response regulator protein-glutamate methylesterase [Kineosporiaceae bacterium]|nr:chemotaxis response regulator protein-glutamate methylesterase [Kineosporiaceae bacterium]MBK7622108.1 chemotaxis response regulator protein-glutamate methylesterase [Kineosporiaceae bacterium]MBK8074418.1 chemotaxis response regulator protein-glutamate methylesterase [Kineosporiaceae bacterium]
MSGPARKIRVLIVDDSAVIRKLVTEALTADPQIEVIGSAQNGQLAVERVARLKPDAVTMDIEMPVMNGIDAVRVIRRTNPRLPIVMFSTLTERGASATLDALQAGASDYVTKPSNVSGFAQSQANVREQLIPKLKALTGIGMRPLASAPRPPAPRPAGPKAQRTGPYQAVVLGCSTGGPDALSKVLATMPGNLAVPVVIVQHMPPVFTRLLAQRLDMICPLRVTEAVEGDEVVPGRVLIAPGGSHLEVRRRGTSVVAHLTDAPPENFCRPAVDVLFRSAVSVYADRLLAVVLTGMGRDGEKGARLVRDAGGEVIAQDEPTSVVWGMPGAVTTSGLADKVVPLDKVSAEVVASLSRGPAPVGVG